MPSGGRPSVVARFAGVSEGSPMVITGASVVP